MEENPPRGKGPSELTFQKLNHLIKGQLRFLLMPDDGQYTENNSNNIKNQSEMVTSNHSNHTSSNHSNNTTNSDKCNGNGSNNSNNSNGVGGGGCNGFHDHNEAKKNHRNNGYQKQQQQQNNKNTEDNNHTHHPQIQRYKRSTDIEAELSRILEIILTDLIMIMLCPIILPLVFLNIVLRWTFTIYHRIRNQGKIRLMRGEDAFWASESPANPGNFTSMYIIQGDCDLSKIRSKLSTSWVEAKDPKGRPLFSKLKLRAVKKSGYFAWEDHDNFDINEHIRFLHPENPKKVTGEDQLFEEIREIYDITLASDKPQWEILIVPNYVYNNPELREMKHYAIIFRIHHSIMDGLSAAQALRMIVADSVVEAGVDPMKPIRAPLWQKMMTYLVAAFLLGPYVLRHNYTSRESNSFHGPSLTGPKTLGWSRPLKLEAIKKMKESTNTSVTAVFISCIGGAFRSLSSLKGHPIPRKMTAVTCAAMIPYPSIKAQNRFCVVFTPIAAKEKLASERLKIAQKSFDNRMVAAAEVIMAYWITWIGGSFPVIVLEWLQEGICHGTVLLSNLPGPKTTT